MKTKSSWVDMTKKQKHDSDALKVSNPGLAHDKGLECIGTACVAAKQAAEHLFNQGESIPDALKAAARALKKLAEEMAAEGSGRAKQPGGK